MNNKFVLLDVHCYLNEIITKIYVDVRIMSFYIKRHSNINSYKICFLYIIIYQKYFYIKQKNIILNSANAINTDEKTKKTAK